MLKLKLAVAMILMSGSFANQAFAIDAQTAAYFQDRMVETHVSVEFLYSLKEKSKIDYEEFKRRLAFQNSSLASMLQTCEDIGQTRHKNRYCAKEVKKASDQLLHEIATNVISVEVGVELMHMLDAGQETAEAGNGVERGKSL